MSYVIDASVAVKWFIRENLHEEALTLTEHAEPLHAPDWVVQEIAHAVFKKWRNGEIDADQARTAVETAPRFLTELYPSLALADHALAIAMTIGHPVYDCLYIACAEAVSGTVVTADVELCNAVEGTQFAHLVQHLGESGTYRIGRLEASRDRP